MMPTELAIAHQQKIKSIIRKRLEYINLAETDLAFRAWVMRKAAGDVKWFVNYWLTTYNPRIRNAPKILPFILFPRQEECFDWIEERYTLGEWGSVVKCRYTGLSWIACAFLVHKLLFETEFSGSLASNKKDLVDKPKNPDALFEKVLMIIKWLPPWMHEIDLDKHRRSMLIEHPKTKSVIKGESGVSIGRGGRSSIVFVDEFATVENDAEAIASLSENTDCAIFISTPKGTGNKFYEQATNPHLSSFYYRWTADPRRTPEWRDHQTFEKGEQISKQELDCDFTASVEGQFIENEWIEACVNSHLKIPGMDRGIMQAGLDIAVSGNNKTILIYRQGSVVTDIITFPGQDTTQTALQVNEMLKERKIPYLCFDADGCGAGVAGALNNIYNRPKYWILEFHGAGSPSEMYWDGLEMTSKELYLNKRAEAYAILRWRIKNTFDHLNGTQEHAPDEMISIPDNDALRVDLTKPIAQYTTNGKLKLESKEDMRKRGISSPDMSDALAYSFYEDQTASWILKL